MRLHRAALAIACTLLLAGCLPVTSKTPVGTTAGLGADEALYGTWTGHGEDGTAVTFHFVPWRTTPTRSPSWSAPNTDSPSPKPASMCCTTKSATTFLNAAQMLRRGQSAGEPVERREHAAALQVREERQADASSYGRGQDQRGDPCRADRGHDRRRRQWRRIEITADAAALDAFMAKPEASKLFKLLIVLRRTE